MVGMSAQTRLEQCRTLAGEEGAEREREMAFTSPLPSSSASTWLVTLTVDAAVVAAASRSSSPRTLPPAVLNERGRRLTAEPGGGRSIRRRLLLAASTASLLLPSTLLRPIDANSTDRPWVSSQSARAAAGMDDDPQQEEDRVVRIFEETSPSVVFIKDLQLQSDQKKRGIFPSSASTSLTSTAGGGGEEEDWVSSDDDGNAKVEGTGSGFVWDKAGHIVTNYHVIEKLATDQTGLQRCKILLQDSNGNTFAKEGKLIGLDPAYDLAVLKVNVEGDKLRPPLIGTSSDLRVGQSCFAIGNPYGYEHTLTTGVVSGLGREIPSPNGRSIRGAIQTDAAINAGNSGGPLIDSYGHVIGVNTATFTRKGTGISSGVNFAIPIDAVVRIVPYLIVYGTSVSNRF